MKEEEPSGLSAEELFERGIGITYDDFSVLDTHFTDIDRKEINLETTLGGKIILKTPIIAAPMDTVTNSELCIALALEGGIGCIHYNYKNHDGSLNIEEQIKEIERVKKFENGFIENPVTVSPDYTIAQVIEIGEKNKIGKSPIDTFPVTYEGKPHSQLLGLLRKQDYSRTIHTDLKVKDRMVPLEKIIMAEWPITLDQANDKLWNAHLLFLPIVDKEGTLKYLVTRKDIDKNEEFPLSTKDSKKRLRVLFAVETETRTNFAYERLERGFAAGADGCIIDTSQGFTKYEINMAKHILDKYHGKLVIGGNITTPEAYRRLEEIGIHAYRNGQGSGSTCTTPGAIGVSRAGASGVYHCAKLKGNMVTIADGGLKKVGDITKTLTIGANVAMLGNMLAGTEESPQETKLDPITGLPVKEYRGMGSKEAMEGKEIRGYSRLPQGISGHVEYKGSIHMWVPLIRDGLISSFHALNCRDIKELHKKMYSGQIRFERRTIGSLQESRTHDLVK